MPYWKKKLIALFAVLLILGTCFPQGSAEWHWYPTEDGIVSYAEGKSYWISIDENTLAEYADLLGEELELPTAAVAGILANLQCESGFDATKVGDDGYAFGICQWRGARLDGLVQFCKEEKLNPVHIEGQLRYLIYDLKENYIYAHDLLLSCKNTEEGAVRAAFYFCSQYEAPSNPEEISPEREELAKNLIYPLLKELRTDRQAQQPASKHALA